MAILGCVFFGYPDGSCSTPDLEDGRRDPLFSEPRWFERRFLGGLDLLVYSVNRTVQKESFPCEGLMSAQNPYWCGHESSKRLVIGGIQPLSWDKKNIENWHFSVILPLLTDFSVMSKRRPSCFCACLWRLAAQGCGKLEADFGLELHNSFFFFWV